MAIETFRRKDFTLTDADIDKTLHDRFLEARYLRVAPTGEEVDGGDQLGLVGITPNEGSDLIVFDYAGWNEHPLGGTNGTPSWTARRNAMLATQTNSIVVAPAIPGTFLELPDAEGVDEDTDLSQLGMAPVQFETLRNGSFERLARGMTRATLKALEMSDISLHDKRVVVMGGSQGASTASASALAFLKAGYQPKKVITTEATALAPVPFGALGMAKRFFTPAEQDVSPYVVLNPEFTRDKSLDEGGRAWQKRLIATRAVHWTLMVAMTQGKILRDIGKVGDFEGTEWDVVSGEHSGLSPLELNKLFAARMEKGLGKEAVRQVVIEEGRHPIGVAFDLAAKGVNQLAS